MHKKFEAAGNLDSWPPNVPGKATRAAVFGVRGKSYEILWSGEFPDLEPAMYWAAKKEMQAVRKGKWPMASRVLWQHDLSPEQAVAVIHQHMRPQIEQALAQAEMGSDQIDIGTGPMRPVNPAEAEKFYVELDAPDGTSQSFIIDADAAAKEIFQSGNFFESYADDENDGDDPKEGWWIQNDPRDA